MDSAEDRELHDSKSSPDSCTAVPLGVVVGSTESV